MEDRTRPARHDQILVIFFIFIFLIGGCASIGRPVGIAGQYGAGKEALIKPRGIGVDQAIFYLEEVAKRDPFYEDTLTLLGRAYYKKGRYRDVYAMLQRALAANKNDEMAWIVLGLAQLRLGEDRRGLESLTGGITLLSKVQTDYLGYRSWDRRGMVQSGIRRAAFEIKKGLDEKENLIRATEALIYQVENEEHFQRTERKLEYNQELN